MKKLIDSQIKNLETALSQMDENEKMPFGKKAIQAIIDRLVELKTYEDLEEQGLLVKLPCKVNDTVWEFDKDTKEIKEYKVRRMKTVNIELDFVGNNYVKSTLVSCSTEHIGSLIFLTREEAEQALERMKADD
jgi:hypothetical protein